MAGGEQSARCQAESYEQLVNNRIKIESIWDGCCKKILFVCLFFFMPLATLSLGSGRGALPSVAKVRNALWPLICANDRALSNSSYCRWRYFQPSMSIFSHWDVCRARRGGRQVTALVVQGRWCASMVRVGIPPSIVFSVTIDFVYIAAVDHRRRRDENTTHN